MILAAIFFFIHRWEDWASSQRNEQDFSDWQYNIGILGADTRPLMDAHEDI
jgi:hypothetical protein